MKNTIIKTSNGIDVPLFRVLGSYRAGVDIVHKVQLWIGESPGKDPVVIRWMGHDEWRAMVGLADG
jgi:hypothetical protein